MFGLLRGRTKEAVDPVGSAADDSDSATDDALDAVLDTLSSLLRTYGRHALDTDRSTAGALRERFDGWARHVLTGAAAPADGALLAANQEPQDAPTPLAGRGWARLRQVFAEVRAEEVSHFDAVGATLRGTVLELMDVVHRALGEAKGTDAALGRRATELRAALGSQDLDAIRSAAERVAISLEDNLARREEIHARAVASLGRRLRTVREELKQATLAAEIDALTGLANRAALDRRLEASLTIARFTGQPEALLMLDVDHFKTINDTHGHRVGDRALAALGECLARTVIRRTDYVARYGGEEFVVVLSDTEPEQAIRVGERLLDEIRALTIPLDDGQVLRFTASVGAAELRPSDALDSWLDAADHAMYRAKQGGRDRLCVRTA